MTFSPTRLSLLTGLLALSLLFGGCSDVGFGGGGFGGADMTTTAEMSGAVAPADPNVPSVGGSTGVSQAGAQDFGLFRQILEAGGLPAPSTLDSLGFFAEHKLDYPTAECGQNLCMHGLLGVMGNMISGSNCTLIQVGLNTPIDVADLPRPPMHLVLAVDTSGSMDGDPISSVRTGLDRMLDHLDPADLISLVTYSSSAKVVLEAVPATDLVTLKSAFDALNAAGKTNLYDGLFTAFDLADAHRDPTWQNRVIFLSDGVATVGLQSKEKMASLAEGYARLGIGITTIGVGTEFDHATMLAIAEVGAGNFYFLEDPEAVKEVFTEEVKTFLHPVAVDVQVDVAIDDTYRIGQVYGTNGWTGSKQDGSVDIPSLFLAGRTDASDPVEGGRRGGGGAIMLELIPMPGAQSLKAGDVIGTLDIAWTDPLTGEVHSQEDAVVNPSDDLPIGGWFTDATVEKGFVMLNIFAGFQIASELCEQVDYPTAISTLEALRDGVASWLADQETPDPDITDDLTYVEMFIDNIVEANNNLSTNLPPNEEVIEPWPWD